MFLGRQIADKTLRTINVRRFTFLANFPLNRVTQCFVLRPMGFWHA